MPALAGNHDKTSRVPQEFSEAEDEEFFTEKRKRASLDKERAELERRARYVRFEYPDGVERVSAEYRLLAEDCFREPGDSGSPQLERPPWYDGRLFREGQRVARDYGAGLAEAELVSLFLQYAVPLGMDPLVATGWSDDPESAGQRYLAASKRMLTWYESDPFDASSEAYRNMVLVRGMHARIRKLCNEASPEDLAGMFTIGKGQTEKLMCPGTHFYDKTFAALPSGAYLGPCPALRNPADGELSLGVVKLHADPYRRPFMTQGEMAVSQWGFFAVFALKPQVFGAPYISRAEVEALVHLWAVIGYCLGIEDRFNFALGGLEKVLRRSETYLRTVAVPNLQTLGRQGSARWEHMCRCMVEGIALATPLPPFEVHLAYLFEDVLGMGQAAADIVGALSWRQTVELWKLRLLLRGLPRCLPASSRWLARGLATIISADNWRKRAV